MLIRTQYLKAWQELSSEKSMVFLSGPRQAGKTTLSKLMAESFSNSLYFNWDIHSDRSLLFEDPYFFEQIERKDDSIPLIIFDEIHKYKNWKNYLKGIYDQFAAEYKFLVSGSGRLDLYQKGSDSLAGRYFYFHLFPLTVAELSKNRRKFSEFIKSPLNGFDLNDRASTRQVWSALLDIGGFPEPFVKGKKSFWTKWSGAYARQIIREDIRSISDIKNVDNMEVLFSLLPSKVGSPFSINNIAGDLQVAFDTVKNWLRLFDIFYLTFRISPWTSKIPRSILKEKKLYLFNYPEIQNAADRFENMVALELSRAIHTWNEYGYGRFALHYLRNKDKQEVDFLISEQNKPVLLVETKLSDDTLAKNLVNFQNILHIPAVQLVQKENVFKYLKNGQDKALIVTAHQWLSSLP